MDAKTIGIITPNMDGQYFGGLIYHLHNIACSQGIRLILVTTLRSDNRYNIPLAAHVADGWMSIKQPVNPDVLDHLKAAGKPIVGIGFQSNDYPCVYLNDFRMMETATRHLVEHSHRRIAFVGDLKNLNFQKRFAGYRHVLEQSGIPFDQSLVVDSMNLNESEEARAAFGQIYGPATDCTAAVCCTDFLASQIVRKLQQQGVRVPHEFAVVGIDNSPRTWGYLPELTTVHVPVQQMAEEAIQRLVTLMHGGTAAPSPNIDAPLIVRESCGCTGTAPAVRELKHTLELFDRLEAANEVGRRVSNLLVSGNTKKIEDLSWLNNTHIKWAAYCKWTDSSENCLEVVSFTSEQQQISPIGQYYKAENFPALDLLSNDVFHPESGMIPVLYPIQSVNRNWGVLALAQKIDSALLHYRAFPLTYSFALLGAAFDRLELFDQNQHMTRTLETVSNMTNDGIWELDLNTRTLTWNVRTQSILGFIIGSDLDTFIGYIHPDDRRDAVDLFTRTCPTGERIQKMFRVQRVGNDYLWIEIAAKVVEDNARMIGSIRDITERKQSEQKISFMAYHDNLTGLPNRAFFLNRLKEAILNARESGYNMAILLIDLDRFKTINDTYGHHMGDLVLKYVSDQLRMVNREGDMVSRHGGDEFTMLVPKVTVASEIYELCDRIMQLFKEPFVHEGKTFHVTGSVGFSLFPHDGEDVDTLINNADTAMYQAKSEGRNRYEYYQSDLSVLMRGRLMMEQSLQNALINQEFELAYQPQVDVRTGTVIGVEALLRWDSPELGRISPMEFIPVAEETGLIGLIGEWVLEEACLQNVRWERMGIQALTMSVNISSIQLRDNDFVEKVRNILKKTGHSPHKLCLEITETTTIHNMELCVPKLRTLMEEGVQIALDDFGTGYSSLSVLSSLPLHIVKIDKSFIQHLTESEKGERKTAIVKSIIAMSQELGLVTLAEGVETDAQMSMLSEYGCDSYQGYLFSRPLPASQIETILSKQLAL